MSGTVLAMHRDRVASNHRELLSPSSGSRSLGRCQQRHTLFSSFRGDSSSLLLASGVCLPFPPPGLEGSDAIFAAFLHNVFPP